MPLMVLTASYIGCREKKIPPLTSACEELLQEEEQKVRRSLTSFVKS